MMAMTGVMRLPYLTTLIWEAAGGEFNISQLFRRSTSLIEYPGSFLARTFLQRTLGLLAVTEKSAGLCTK